METAEMQQSIRTELIRLQLHPVNLDVVSEEGTQATLSGSLMMFWQVPKTLDAAWFLKLLKSLPDNLGPKATMDAFAARVAADKAIATPD